MQVLITELHALQAPVWWGQPVPVQRRSRPGSAIEGSGEARDPVQLPRPPGRRTFVQLRSSIWWAGAAGVLALGLAAAALWVALDQRAQTRLAQPAIRPAASSPAAPAALTAASALAVPMAPLPLPASSRPVVAVAPVPVAPVSVPVAVAANAAPPASTESVRGEMPECAQLSVYEPPMTRMTVAQLEQRARDVKYLAPSAIANQLQAIKANADSFHPDSRECLYRAMLIRMVLNEKVVLASSPALWGHTRDVPELERLFLEQPLQQDWSLAQRKDVLRQVETLFIANLQKDAPGDDVYWRRMYYGMLFACEATDEARSKAGAKRIPENNCLKLKPTV